MTLLVASDIDQTIFRHQFQPDYANVHELYRTCQPRPEILAPLRILHQLGNKIAYITGRTTIHRDATIHLLKQHELPPGSLWMQEAWLGWQTYENWKTQTLIDLGCDAYIGDNDYDARAAHRAGITYIDANTIHLTSYKPPTRTLEPQQPGLEHRTTTPRRPPNGTFLLPARGHHPTEPHGTS